MEYCSFHPEGQHIHFTQRGNIFRIPESYTNNMAKYEAVRKGMELLLEAGAEAVEIFGDSKLIIAQLTEEYRCESSSLYPLWVQCKELMAKFRYINFQWVR